MKLLSFEAAGKRRFGAVAGEGIVDLTGEFGSLREALAANALARLRESAAARKPQLALDEVTFLTPIPVPEKIICVGVNYGNRNEEYKDGSAPPKYPSVFPRFPGSFVGHRAHPLRPPESNQLDYEGEIAIVIGTAGRRIAEADAE